jgi:hypothetical protein
VRGATELHRNDGTRIGELSVKTSDFHSALSLIRRSGILGSSFALAVPVKPARVVTGVEETAEREREKPAHKNR